MELNPGVRSLLVIHVDPQGNLGVTGPIDNVPAFLDIMGKALLVVAQHQAAKAAPPSGIVKAVAVPSELPPLNGTSRHPPLRRI